MEPILSHQKVPRWIFHISQRKPPLQESSTKSPQQIHYQSEKKIDAGCTIIFSKTDVNIYNIEDQCILTGMRDLHNCLWDIQVDLLPVIGPAVQHAN